MYLTRALAGFRSEEGALLLCVCIGVSGCVWCGAGWGTGNAWKQCTMLWLNLSCVFHGTHGISQIIPTNL